MVNRQSTSESNTNSMWNRSLELSDLEHGNERQDRVLITTVGMGGLYTHSHLQSLITSNTEQKTWQIWSRARSQVDTQGGGTQPYIFNISLSPHPEQVALMLLFECSNPPSHLGLASEESLGAAHCESTLRLPHTAHNNPLCITLYLHNASDQNWVLNA